MEKKTLKYDVYLKQYEQIVKYQQANYDNFEKTLLTLSSAFLAFSVSFIGLLKKKAPDGTDVIVINSYPTLVASWICFASAIFLILMCFPIGALSWNTEIIKIEEALEDASSLNKDNKWKYVSYILYVLSVIGFIFGIVLLLIFCKRNIQGG